MILLNPVFLWIGLGGAALTLVIHLIVTRRPHATILPTARFIPDEPAISVSRTTRPDDLLLLLLRSLILLLAGLGLSGPLRTPSRVAEARVVLADLSGSVNDANEVRDSSRRWARPGDTVIGFDTIAFTLASADSIGAVRTRSSGSLSLAMVSALRAASSFTRSADSVSLVIVSAFSDDEVDAATDSIRSLWPGSARLVRVQGRRDTVGRNTFIYPASPGDPLSVTASIASAGTLGIAIQRTETAVEGAAVLHWPIAARPRFAVRHPPDTVMGVRGGGSLVVAAFERGWRFPSDSLRNAIVVARWIDGEPAVIERPTSTGCLRSSAIGSELPGDISIRSEFVSLFRVVTRPCGYRNAAAPLPPPRMALLQRGNALAPAEAFTESTRTRSPLTPWLLGSAVLLGVLELFVRHRPRTSA